ncbi:MAG: NmrA family NAD(P)-binding protein [Deltaproteobacteria bacterium]|nr:NmrA family NAD(P)-binding protein [Deltaproteobacteria bacterium]
MRAVVTGAFSNSGAAVAAELLRRGYSVHTLTNRRVPAAVPISHAPLQFDRQHLVEQLRGADLLVNTYWVRLADRLWPTGRSQTVAASGLAFAGAVERSRLLIDCAREAQVGRLVHFSVSNAERGRNLGYYGGKHQVERHIRDSGICAAIVRPTLVVGPNDVLSGNITWFLRRFPVFLMPRGGRYRLQPIVIDDLARIVADLAERTDYAEVDAAGPEVFSFREYVQLLAKGAGVRRWLLSAPNGLAMFALRLVGKLLSDVVLTSEELLGLQQELLLSHDPPLGRLSVSQWVLQHGAALGRRYTNDNQRHFLDHTPVSQLAEPQSPTTHPQD